MHPQAGTPLINTGLTQVSNMMKFKQSVNPQIIHAISTKSIIVKVKSL